MNSVLTFLKNIAQRTGRVLLGVLIGIDIIAQNLIRGLIYIPTGHCKPGERETISAWIGTAAAAGYRWGILSEEAINDLFGPTHCQSAATDEVTSETAAF